MTLRTLALFSCCFLLLSACGDADKAPGAQRPAPNVSVYQTVAKDTPMVIEFVGVTSGAKDITIRARIEGFLEGVHFQEGSWIKKGDPLYTLESQSYEEKVAARMSEVAEVNTMLAKNKGDLARIEPLAKINAVSQSDLDSSQASYDASLASLEAAEGQPEGRQNTIELHQNFLANRRHHRQNPGQGRRFCRQGPQPGYPQHRFPGRYHPGHIFHY